MDPHCFDSPFAMTPAMRLEFVHQQLEHHTHVETVNRYRDEGRLDAWDAICDQLVDHYWFLEGLVRNSIV